MATTGPEEVAVVLAKAAGEPDGQADSEVVGDPEIQLSDGAYLLREEFQRGYKSAWWAGKFLDEWTSRVMRSRLEPMKKIARSIRNRRPLILNWFRARGLVSAGAVEGFNNKVKLVTRKSYGFRTAKVAKLALLHYLGQLPEPIRTHRFC
jgi:transposase